MASEFIGLTVLITLKDPANTKLLGTIVNIINKDLVLANVTFLNNGYQIPTYTVQGPMIEGLDVVPANYPQEEEENIPPMQAQEVASPGPPQSAQTFQPQPTPPAVKHAAPPLASHFIDPAILSFTRAPPPAALASAARPPAAQVSTYSPLPLNYIAPPPQVTPVVAAAAPPPPPPPPRSTSSGPTSLRANQSVPALRQSPKILRQQEFESHPAQPPAALQSVARKLFTAPQRGPTLLKPVFQEYSLRDVAGESSAFDETDDALSALPNQSAAFSGKRSRRGGKGRRDSIQDSIGATGARSTPLGYGMSILGSGKQQRKHSKNGHYQNGNDEEGWATEDVNDIRETEFDFQGNLDRFDKKTVFSQIRAEDTTADEARLVSFNRLPQRKDKVQPLRKNYKNTENVLGTYANGQPLEDRDTWNSPVVGEEDSSESDDFRRGRDGAVNSGRSSRRAMSRSVPRRPSTKQGSATTSALMTQGASSSGGGPVNINAPDPKSRGSIRISSNTRPGQAMNPLDSERNRVCPIVSPLQMLDVERIAETEMGLEEILMTENAARGIASVAIQAFGTRLTSQNHNPLPVVLVFAGNNKTGARAIAAGRHLKNHHVRVMVCVVGLDREDELLENVRRQLNIFRNAGGRVVRLSELATSLKSIDAPPELIIDGLLGIHIAFEDLRTDDQATAYELVNFANKSSASVLSVDVPSGIDGHTGELAMLDSDSGDRGHGQGSFCVRARWVVSLGDRKSVV